MRTKHRLSRAMRENKDPVKEITSLVDQFGRESNQEDWTSKIVGALRSRRFDLAVSFAADPPHTAYEEPRKFLLARQIAAFVRKVPWDDSSLKPDENAIRKFLSVEHRMRRINQRFRAEIKVGRESYSELRSRMRSHLRRLLGDEPSWTKWWERCDFGPGATVGCSGEDTSIVRKVMESDLTVTPSCLPFALLAVWSNPHLRAHFCPHNGGKIYCLDYDEFKRRFLKRVKLVPYNQIALVDKTALIKRVIAKEGSLTSFVQKGFDTVLRELLLKVGVDLSDQRRNQILAMLGSLGEHDDPLCTLDLESASDCNARMLSRDLFPPAWYSALTSISSGSYKLPDSDEVFKYEKLCSMGNGVCFPVESLIFWAAIVATLEMCNTHPTFAVYGDDIIVRQSAALLLVEHLTFLGFRVNKSKSFFFGNFRESCGADWFLGKPVRPYILDFLPRSERDLMKIYNGLVIADTIEPVKSHLMAKTINCPAQPLGWSEMRDGALFLPLDQYMTHWSAKWDRDRQSWNPLLFRDKPVKRRKPRSIPLLMYYLLRGAPADADALPQVTLRRLTNTRMCRETHPVDQNVVITC